MQIPRRVEHIASDILLVRVGGSRPIYLGTSGHNLVKKQEV